MTMQTIYPALVYADAPAAIAFLERAFGFVAEHVYPGAGDAIAHAQLRAGSDLVMLGSANPASALSDKHTSPQGFGGRGSLALYVHVADIEALYTRACAAGAKIVRPLGGTEYDASQSFTAEDSEGYVWAFGTYAASKASNVSVCLRYEDAATSIAWLREVCGFGEQLIVPEGDARIAHGELTLGAGVLMCASRRDDDLAFDSPARLGGTTGSVYVYVEHPGELYAHVRKAGATLRIPIRDTDYGSREFSVRDPEGTAFTFGTYRP
jgi:uncharacterized glyoxalase superfamily protein PhnB